MTDSRRLANRCNCFTCRETVAPSVIGLQVGEGFVLPTDSYKHPQWSTGQDLGSGISEQCDDTHTPRPFLPLLRDVIMDSDFYVPDVANSRPVAGCARVNGFCQDFCQRKLPSGCLDALPCVLWSPCARTSVAGAARCGKTVAMAVKHLQRWNLPLLRWSIFSPFGQPSIVHLASWPSLWLRLETWKKLCGRVRGAYPWCRPHTGTVAREGVSAHRKGIRDH